jgi:hypothetical protein
MLGHASEIVVAITYFSKALASAMLAGMGIPLVSGKSRERTPTQMLRIPKITYGSSGLVLP